MAEILAAGLLDGKRVAKLSEIKIQRAQHRGAMLHPSLKPRAFVVPSLRGMASIVLANEKRMCYTSARGWKQWVEITLWPRGMVYSNEIA